MMKSEFFQLLLHENIINCMKKVKKKTSNNENRERLSFILGAIFFGISIYLCFAFVSYFSTGVWAHMQHGYLSSAVSDCRHSCCRYCCL